MTFKKTTVTVDGDDLMHATALTGASSASEAIRIALRELIRNRRLRNDIAAYRKTPMTPDELAWASSEPSVADLADDTDWEALYADD